MLSARACQRVASLLILSALFCIAQESMEDEDKKLSAAFRKRLGLKNIFESNSVNKKARYHPFWKWLYEAIDQSGNENVHIMGIQLHYGKL